MDTTFNPNTSIIDWQAIQNILHKKMRSICNCSKPRWTHNFLFMSADVECHVCNIKIRINPHTREVCQEIIQTGQKDF